MKDKKKCKHEWHFVERSRFVEGGEWYRFVCVNCGVNKIVRDTVTSPGALYTIEPEVREI